MQFVKDYKGTANPSERIMQAVLSAGAWIEPRA
jgi:hypothetical protein